MARSPASAALLLVLLSLLAVAHCRAVAVAADHAAEPQSTAAVAVRDENGLSSNSNPTLPAEAGASATEEEEVLPAAEQQKPGFEFLRLPSHRLHRHHRPCSHHRHHGVYRDAPRRFHDHYSGHGERREDAVSHLAVFPAEEAREAEEVKPVAEPDPDRSVPDSDREGELMLATTRREPFADADGHDDEHAAAVREVLRRWFHFHSHHGMRRHRLHRVHHHDEEEGEVHEQEEEEAAPEGSMNMKRFHFHRDDDEDEKNMMRKPRPRHAENGMRHHRLHHVHHDEEEEGQEEDAREGVNMKRFHFRHHHDEEDEEKNMMGKRLRHAEHGEDSDGEEEDEQVEEMVRRFRKVIMRRRFGHGHGHGDGRRFFHHDHRHRHDEERSGVMAWIKGLMNRF